MARILYGVYSSLPIDEPLFTGPLAVISRLLNLFDEAVARIKREGNNGDIVTLCFNGQRWALNFDTVYVRRVMPAIPKFVLCTSVDGYGMTGRDHHPTDADINQTFRVDSVEIWHGQKEDVGLVTDDDESYIVLHCTDAAGEPRELMDYEVVMAVL